MKANLKAIATCVNEHKDELLFHKAVTEIKAAIDEGRLLKAAGRGEYIYTVDLSTKPKVGHEDKIKAELASLGLDCTCFCMYGVVQTVTITWY